MSLFDETALRAMVEEATESAVRKVLREGSSHATPVPSVDSWVPTAALARQYSITQATIRQWIRQGRIRSVRVGRALRVNRSDFDSLISPPTGSAPARQLSPEALADRDEVAERRKRRS